MEERPGAFSLAATAICGTDEVCSPRSHRCKRAQPQVYGQWWSVLVDPNCILCRGHDFPDELFGCHVALYLSISYHISVYVYIDIYIHTHTYVFI